MNNNLFINNLKQKNNLNSIKDTKYNPDITQQYDNILKIRNNRQFECSTTVWKPIIGSIDKKNITPDDLKINIKTSNLLDIKSTYEKELAMRKKEQQLIEKTIHNTSKLEDIKIDEIPVSSNFDDLKKIATNIENKTLTSITTLDDLLSSIKNL